MKFCLINYVKTKSINWLIEILFLGPLRKKNHTVMLQLPSDSKKKFRHPYRQHTVITVIPDSSIKKKEDVSTFSIHIKFFFFIQKERKKTMIILIIIKDEQSIDRKLKITTDRSH